MVESLRKLLLIGLMGFVYPGTYSQLLWAGLFSALALGVTTIATPYKSDSDNFLAGGLSLMIVCFFFRSVGVQSSPLIAPLSAIAHCSFPRAHTLSFPHCLFTAASS